MAEKVGQVCEKESGKATPSTQTAALSTLESRWKPRHQKYRKRRGRKEKLSVRQEKEKREEKVGNLEQEKEGEETERDDINRRGSEQKGVESRGVKRSRSWSGTRRSEEGKASITRGMEMHRAGESLDK